VQILYLPKISHLQETELIQIGLIVWIEKFLMDFSWLQLVGVKDHPEKARAIGDQGLTGPELGMCGMKDKLTKVDYMLKSHLFSDG